MRRMSTWYFEAVCHGSADSFFLSQGKRATAAKALCAKCPVRQECRDHAILYGERGIWGGMTEAERDAIKVILLPLLQEQAIAAGLPLEHDLPIFPQREREDSIQSQFPQGKISDRYLNTWIHTSNLQQTI